MTTNNALQPVSSAELQEAIIALIRQNNTELKQLLADVLVAPRKQSKQLKICPNTIFSLTLPYF